MKSILLCAALVATFGLLFAAAANVKYVCICIPVLNSCAAAVVCLPQLRIPLTLRWQHNLSILNNSPNQNAAQIIFTLDNDISRAVNCTTLPDGSYEAGCRSFAVCKGGVGTIVDCEPTKVFNNNTALCDDIHNVSPPCGSAKDCTGKANGKYADVELHCTSYYTCYQEKFYGHNICPAGLVFDEGLVTCNWRDAVAPPCGTKH